MKLEKITENKIKIVFDSNELEENNISLHDILANSIEAQRLFIAILDIANEDLSFDITNCKISYEAFSFEHKTFVIFITKEQLQVSQEIQASSNPCPDSNFFHVLRDERISENSSFKFIDNKLSKINLASHLTYIFNNIESVFDFCKFLSTIIIKNINSSLYKYQNLFILDLSPNNISENNLKQIEYLASEIKSPSSITSISKIRLIEFSQTLIDKDAISKLTA